MELEETESRQYLAERSTAGLDVHIDRPVILMFAYDELLLQVLITFDAPHTRAQTLAFSMYKGIAA